MGGSTSKQPSPEKSLINFSNFCRPLGNEMMMKDYDKNEIILSKTYTYPKGTFSDESTNFFNEKEKYLFYFCQGENIAAIRYLTIIGVHISILDQDRTSPLHISCRSGSLQMVEEIINQGAMINLPDIVGWTALHVACFYKRADVILLLLKYGANLNIKERDGLFPIELVKMETSCMDVINNFVLHSFNFNDFKSKKPLESFDDFEDDMIINDEQIFYNSNFDTNFKKSSTVTNSHKNNLLIYKNKIHNKGLSHRSFIYNNDIENENENIKLKVKENQQKILNNYKIIPKKHKFCMKYKLKENDDKFKEFSNFNKNNNRLSKSLAPQFFKPNTSSQNNNRNSYFNSFRKNANVINNNSNRNKNNNIKSSEKNEGIIKVPKTFPITHNLNKIKESLKISPKNIKNDLLNSFNNPLDFFTRNKLIKKKNSNHLFDFNYNIENENLNDSMRLEEEFIYYNLMTNNNFDGDSEKYKKYSFTNSNLSEEDSFQIDISVMKEREFKNVKNLSNRNNRNKSVHQYEQDKNNNSDFEDLTILIKANDYKNENYEDSMIFSEEFANVRINHKSLNEIIKFNDKNIKIFENKPETEYFLTKIKFSEIFFNIFKLDVKIVDNILLKLFHIDSNFAFLITLNILDTENKFEKLINSIRKNIINKDLIGMIISSNFKEDKFILEIKEKICKKYFDSFEFEKTNLKENLKKSFNLFTIDNDIIKLDKLSKIFANSFYENLNKNEDKKFLYSEDAIYNLIFSILVTDIDIKDKIIHDSLQNINKKFVDLMIILKDLNDGQNYNKEFIKELFKFSKIFGFCNTRENNYKFNKRSIGIYKNNKFKQYYYTYLSEGVLILFNNRNENRIIEIIYIKNINFFSYNLDNSNLIMNIQGKQNKKNILIFKNKSSYIKYKKYDTIQLKFDREEDYSEIKNNLKE